MNDRFIIGVDFDGTIVKHRFPQIGEPVPGAIEWLRRFQQVGASLILWTMRCREGSMGDVLTPAVAYCASQGIHFWGVNENPQQRESQWSTSPKVYAHAYVDDAAAGTPLLRDPGNILPYVDWSLVGPHVLDVLEWLTKAGTVRIDTSQLDHSGSTWSDRINTSPHVELPTPTLIRS
jgi:hypothetical protein